jgi:hypothetical protein
MEIRNKIINLCDNLTHGASALDHITEYIKQYTQIYDNNESMKHEINSCFCKHMWGSSSASQLKDEILLILDRYLPDNKDI